MSSPGSRSLAEQARDHHLALKRLRAAVGPLQSFRDVLCHGAPDRDTPGVMWPDFEAQKQPRLWRNNRPVCKPPARDPRSPAVVAEPAAFVSMYDNHFGHMVAETVPRLLQTLAEAPHDPLWFSTDRPMTFTRTSPMFRAVLDWFGISGDRVRFLHEPTLFRHLRIAAQAEHLGSSVVADGYVDLLGTMPGRRFQPGRPQGITFVSRARLAPQKGFPAGEGYLAACLEALGVRVVYPELLSLPDQMRVYAESRVLVFSEGSAIHGRQLLGRIDQHVSILRRRFRSHLAQGSLEPRCTSLTYVSCYGGALGVADAAGRTIAHAMVSLYRLESVFEHFAAHGIALEQVWNQDDYLRARDRDILAWMAALYAPTVEPWLSPHNDDDALLDQFEPLGLGHLRIAARALLPNRPRDGGPRATPVAS